MRRLVTVLTIILCLISSSVPVFSLSQVALPKQIKVYLKPDVSVELNGTKIVFRDAAGEVVYPIIYNGSTYLPVRAISGLMKEPIEWDGSSKTVFIGKTLSNPNKTVSSIETNSTGRGNGTVIPPKPKLVNAYLKPDVLVMYDFQLQSFKDANSNTVYPIISNGTTYLPVRAISELMKEPIEWDGTKQTVSIGDGEETLPVVGTEDKTVITQAAKDIKKLFEREEVLYYEATAKTTSLKEAASLSEKQLIATTISDNYINAQNLTLEIKAVNTTAFSDDETEAYSKLSSFAESAEYYILVLENISYLAAQDSDYSMLAETFLYFAMDSQAKMEEARVQVESLFE